jgi:peptide-methionine (R)-S-oxide reductase
MVTRRNLIAGAGMGALIAALGPFPRRAFATTLPPGKFAVTHTDAEWHQLLTPEQYQILRDGGTELPYSSPLLHETHNGVFQCAGCALPVFYSKWKYDSNTGWPSFWSVIDGAVIKYEDDTENMVRTALSCSRCGSHLGYLFDDGPPPTGLRHCMDGLALKFVPA